MSSERPSIIEPTEKVVVAFEKFIIPMLIRKMERGEIPREEMQEKIDAFKAARASLRETGGAKEYTNGKSIRRARPCNRKIFREKDVR